MLNVICGPAASGKSTLLDIVAPTAHKGRIISVTTRPRRLFESNGKDYYFVSDEDFLTMVRVGVLVYTTSYSSPKGDKSYMYGIPKESIENAVKSKDNYWVILTPDAANNLVELYGKSIVRVFYLTVDKNERISRMIGRGDKEEAIVNRLQQDSEDFKEYTRWDEYSYQVNDLASSDFIDRHRNG